MTLTPELAVVAFLAMVLGEAWRVTVPGLQRDAPLAQATGVALALATAWPATEGRTGLNGVSGLSGLSGLVGPLLLACLATGVVGMARRSWSSLPTDLARAASSVLVAGTLARLPLPGIGSLFERLVEPAPKTPTVALLLLVGAVAAVAVPMLTRVVVQTVREGASLPAQLGTQLGRRGPLALATATTAAVMALSLKLLGPAAILLFLVPMAVLQPAVTRQRRIREAQRQTLYALSRLTDQAGLTRPGHAVRVARLAVPVAREAGVDDADLPDVEATALLHDVGQVGLSRPIPGGATTEVSARDQRRVAATGAAILARTAELSRLASAVADVGIPHHWAVQRGDVPLLSRVVRVVSAYDDLASSGADPGGGTPPLRALQRIVRATPYEYDPLVVDVLVRQLERRGLLSATQSALLRRPLAASLTQRT